MHFDESVVLSHKKSHRRLLEIVTNFLIVRRVQEMVKVKMIDTIAINQITLYFLKHMFKNSIYTCSFNSVKYFSISTSNIARLYRSLRTMLSRFNLTNRAKIKSIRIAVVTGKLF